jgi:CBS domain-containing protein
MTVLVAHVMTSKLIFASQDHTVERARELMASKHIHALPVVGEGQAIKGIVTTADLARKLDDNTPVRKVMSGIVSMISATEPVSEAARLMREKKLHHLVVVDGKKAIGIVSSFDLLRLVEEKKEE